MSPTTMFLLALAGVVIASSACSAEPRLRLTASAPSAQKLESVSGLTDINLFARQVFELSDGARRLGTVAAGAGRRRGAEGPPVCFVSYFRDAAADVVQTIGAGEWEAETCLDAVAFGLVKSAGADLRLAVIFKAASPNAETWEPVVLRIPPTSGKPMILDAVATRAASLAGAVTVPAVANALSR